MEGIELERCGKWRLVVDRIIEKTSSGCRCLFAKGGKWSELGSGLKKRLWESVVRPGMEYGMEVWWPDKGRMMKLEQVQIKGGRKVLGVRMGGKVPGVVVNGDLGWGSVEWRKDLAVIRYFVKLVEMDEEWGVKKLLRIRLDDVVKNRGKCRRSWLLKVEDILAKSYCATLTPFKRKCVKIKNLFQALKCFICG